MKTHQNSSLTRAVPYALLLLGAVSAMLAIVAGDAILALIGLGLWLVGRVLELEQEVNELKRVYETMEREL